MDEKQFIAQTLTHSLHIQKVVSAFYSDLNQDFVSRGEVLSLVPVIRSGIPFA